MFQLDVAMWSNECSVERCAALNNAKKICCHSTGGGCTKWQNVIIHIFTKIAAKLTLMQFASSQTCRQHTQT